jgi:hypothetical protein
MNRIVASVGLVALGAASVQAQSAIQGPAPKWWSVSATVRGFYDDNLNTQRNPTSRDRVWGGEITPSVGVSLGNSQTTFTADYVYGFLYYDHKPLGNTEKYDQTHTFNANLSHAFSERYSVRVKESFVVGQEPDALRTGVAFPTPFRVSGNNIANSGGIIFNAELTPVFGVELGYNNNWFDYADNFSTRGFIPGVQGSKNVDQFGNVIPSNSGTLDRIEQTPYFDLRWHVAPETVAKVGYQFGQVNYTANEPIQGNVLVPASITRSPIRDNRSHAVYAGLEHQFRPDFFGNIQAGASYYDYYNLNQTSIGPVGSASLTYVYALESTLALGVQYGRSATDVVGSSPGKFVHDTDSAVVFAALRQRIAPNFFGRLTGNFQNSSFNGGGPGFNNKTEQFYEFGADLEYKFNSHFSAHAGYDFDHLDSDLGRSYFRNKVYIGATASY